MRNSLRVFLFGLVLAVVTPNVATSGQGRPASSEAGSRSVSVPTREQAPASATQPPTAGGLHQDEVTGDWGGVRSRCKDKGVVFDSSLTQFYQGVASGGSETGSEYNATAQAKLEFDFGKLAGWEHW